jgi:hypothetical protein
MAAKSGRTNGQTVGCVSAPAKRIARINTTINSTQFKFSLRRIQMRFPIYRFSATCIATIGLGLSSISPGIAATRRFSQQIQGSGSFEVMIQQAEAIAEETANQAFRDSDTTEIVVNIAAEQAGQIAPILFLNVTRENWQRQQNIQVWAKYPGGVKRLLGFERPVPLQPGATMTFGRSETNVTASNPIRDRMTEREANFYK